MRDDLRRLLGERALRASDLCTELRCHRSTLRYHLRVLERDGAVASTCLGGQRFYHHAGAEDVHVLILREVLGPIALRRLLSGKPLSPRHAAALHGSSPATMRGILRRLRDESLLVREGEHRPVYSVPVSRTPSARL